MNPILRRALPVFAAFVLAGAARAAPSTADVPAPEKRRATVDQALALAATSAPAPLTGELVNPFNPSAFGQPDPEEMKAILAAQNAAAQAAAQSKPTTDRQLLQLIAAKIMPSGTVIIGGEARLIFGQKRLHVGDRLTVTYDGQDYPLELTAIDRTTFTLRLNRDEITRPIKPAKTP